MRMYVLKTTLNVRVFFMRIHVTKSKGHTKTTSHIKTTLDLIVHTSLMCMLHKQITSHIKYTLHKTSTCLQLGF